MSRGGGEQDDRDPPSTRGCEPKDKLRDDSDGEVGQPHRNQLLQSTARTGRSPRGAPAWDPDEFVYRGGKGGNERESVCVSVCAVGVFGYIHTTGPSAVTHPLCIPRVLKRSSRLAVYERVHM